ncbi:hypothetical protein Pcinc_019689 [Petrolisthes cinctipes]|uniref:Neurotransmitter-gated ion-channel ligand-binding domain-containing protein n=1 Tax=Petrolisthes cinctipes TaxID=88211 RepID=A0AAE1FLL7_PETCI|nr:hypothetical protein Pcinc_019689 [Petrolisthes cinctipes]
MGGQGKGNGVLVPSQSLLKYRASELCTLDQEQVGAGDGWGRRRASRVRAARGGSWSRAVVAGVLVAAAWLAGAEGGNPDAKRLYDDLLSNYNKLVRPVVNVTDVLTVNIKLKLSQLIDVVSIIYILL